MYTLFIDDERFPIASYITFDEVMEYTAVAFGLIADSREMTIVVRSYEEMEDVVEKFGTPTHVDFDHDLGEGLNGYDCARYFVGRYLDGLGFPDAWAIHSQNPIGRQNIDRLMNNLLEYKKSEEEKERT